MNKYFERADTSFSNVVIVTDSSNWMRFVRAAESFKDQNLILSQQGHSLYFTTTRVIHPRQELQVWYSFPYANKRGLSLLQPDKEKRGKIVQFSWNLSDCCCCCVASLQAFIWHLLQAGLSVNPIPDRCHF